MKEVDPRDTLEQFVERFEYHKDAAKALKISRPYLSDMLRGRKGISPSVLDKIGLRQIVVRIA